MPHDHDHAAHPHSHSHAPRPEIIAASLVQMGAGLRLAAALIACGLIWAMILAVLS